MVVDVIGPRALEHTVSVELEIAFRVIHVVKAFVGVFIFLPDLHAVLGQLLHGLDIDQISRFLPVHARQFEVQSQFEVGNIH